jgi:hypothetical protein
VRKLNHGPRINAPESNVFFIVVLQKVSFWFATGGAGFCLSRPLAERIVAPSGSSDDVVDGNNVFVSTGERIRLPDDVTLGYIVEHRLGVPLTHVKRFHSHLEPLRLIPRDQLHRQISFSYSKYNAVEENSVDLDVADGDQTRFIALHCHLFPGSLKNCPK